MSFVWTKYEEVGLTGNFKIARFKGELKMMCEVKVKKTRTLEMVERYDTFRPATPEDCEFVRITSGVLPNA